MPIPTLKRILVTGDWVADWNLERPAEQPEGYFDGGQQTQLHYRTGGAWYVAHLIRNVACRDITAPAGSLEVEVAREEVTPGLNDRGEQRNDLAHAYSVWEKHQRLSTGKEEDKVWRISRLAGCRKSNTWPELDDPVKATANLVVVDDLNLGFSDDPRALGHVVAHAGKDAAILLKHGVRPGSAGLLGQLLDKKLGERLHVVTSASALRRRNAALSRSLSWDKALEDIESEFESGPSSHDLARCATAVIHFGLAGAAVFKAGTLFRFYFLPDELEQVYEDGRPGQHFGTSSVLTACMARHLVLAEDYPLFFAVTQALAAQRTAHEDGGGSGPSLDIDQAFGPRGKIADPSKNQAAACIGTPPDPPKPTPGTKPPAPPKCATCIEPFRTAWNPKELQVWPEAATDGRRPSRLLRNVTGTTSEALMAKAVDVVVHGPMKALASVPKAVYGKYVTADRDEIESINEIRRLILEYKSNPADKNPLSIAVFGAPGTGKSFAIKEIAKAIFGKEKQPLEFNLTQFKSQGDLHRAFQQVRDASIRREIPLVFWDEFDAGRLQWLAAFLAPMQDHEFFDGSHKHPFGKCIFIFAGGTRVSFKDFKKWCVLKEGEKWKTTESDPWHQSFKDVKGPDFISRLRGVVNVKGPNPTREDLKATHEECVRKDPAYALRRAIILRVEIERNFRQLVDPRTDRVAIAPNVLHAMLTVERYEHGSRSISALLGMSALGGARAFTASVLPSKDLLGLHVSDDFEKKLAEPSQSTDLHDRLAKAGFEGWKAAKTQQGYAYGPRRNDDLKLGRLAHPRIKEWDLLTREEKIGDYDPVWRRLLAIQQAGWRVQPRQGTSRVMGARQRAALIEALLAPEHKIWLADHLATGYLLAPQTRDHLRLHSDIKQFSKLSQKQKSLNRSIVAHTLEALHDAGFCVVRNRP